jgi:AraC-like DNA-binding protein
MATSVPASMSRLSLIGVTIRRAEVESQEIRPNFAAVWKSADFLASMQCASSTERASEAGMRSTPDKATVEVTDSFVRWHEVTCSSYSVSKPQRDATDAFRVRLSSRAFGALALTEGRTFSMGSTRLVRGAAEIRRDPRDGFVLFLVMDGQMGVVQHGREVHARPGDLFLYDQASPFILDFPQRRHTIMLNIPRQLMEARIPRAHIFAARRIAGDTALGGLAGTMVRQLAAFDAGTNIEISDRVSAATLDIVATALGAETLDDVPSDRGRHRLRGSVETYLLANLHDPGLSIRTIASALNIAPRTLNRIFGADGTTPMRWLWQQRLGAGCRALTEGRITSVTEAALSFGFSDVSHFSRAFKAAFGKSPHTLKHR